MTSVSHEPSIEPPPSGEDPAVPSPEEIAEELDAAAEESARTGVEDERRYPSTIGGAFYLVVLAVGTLGIGIAGTGDWRLGIRFLAAALCFAALLRMVLPRKDAGMLAVRHRLLDAVLLGGVGAALFFLAATIPNQPG